MILSKYRHTLLVCLFTTGFFWGCGKKGPPLAPLIRMPAPLTELAVRRLGNEVYVGFTLPTADQDGTQPADLIRVDVYGMTTEPRLPPDRTLELEEFLEASTLVDSIEVGPPLPPLGSVSQVADMSEDAADEKAKLPQGFAAALSEILTPEIEIPVDPWEDEREEPDDEEELEESLVSLLVTPPSAGVLQREYVVVSVTSQGTEVEASERIAVPLSIRSPMPPPAPTVVYTETEIAITWELPSEVRSSVQTPTTGENTMAATPFPLPAIVLTLPQAAVLFNQTAALVQPVVDDAVAIPPLLDTTPAVAITALIASFLPTFVPTPPPGGTTLLDATPAVAIRALMASFLPTFVSTPPPGVTTSLSGPIIPALIPLASRPIVEWELEPVLDSSPVVEWPLASRYEVFEVVEPPEGRMVMPQPLNPEPLTARSYADTRVIFGTGRCYGVRTLDTVEQLELRSDLSVVTCVDLVDVFRPAPPESLSAVASEGEVSLIWAPNDDVDLAGYIVLRGLPEGETLQPLTTAPVAENTYRDTTAEPGTVYSYAVRAVDLAFVPNFSELSNRVEEAAR